MNGTHVAVGATAGIGGTSITTALTILLTDFHGLSADRAGAAAFLITAVIGAAASAVAWYMQPTDLYPSGIAPS